jgi:hypothetical protein
MNCPQNKLEKPEFQLPANKDELKKVCCEFFRYWWNQPGNNTEQGFDEWYQKKKLNL